jgi:hypothetical protein
MTKNLLTEGDAISHALSPEWPTLEANLLVDDR